MKITTLPIELLTSILLDPTLPAHSVVSICSTCHFFHTLLKRSTPLQLRIELFKHGMHIPETISSKGFGGMGLEDTLKYLKEREANWLEGKLRYTRVNPFDDVSYVGHELDGGDLVVTRCVRDQIPLEEGEEEHEEGGQLQTQFALDFVKIPRCDHRRYPTHRASDNVSASIDPYYTFHTTFKEEIIASKLARHLDLVVIASGIHDPSSRPSNLPPLHLHFFQLSSPSSTPHPLAFEHTIPLPFPQNGNGHTTELILCASIKVLGSCYVLLLVDWGSNGHTFDVLNWRTGCWAKITGFPGGPFHNLIGILSSQPPPSGLSIFFLCTSIADENNEEYTTLGFGSVRENEVSGEPEVRWIKSLHLLPRLQPVDEIALQKITLYSSPNSITPLPHSSSSQTSSTIPSSSRTTPLSPMPSVLASTQPLRASPSASILMFRFDLIDALSRPVRLSLLIRRKDLLDLVSAYISTSPPSTHSQPQPDDNHTRSNDGEDDDSDAAIYPEWDNPLPWNEWGPEACQWYTGTFTTYGTRLLGSRNMLYISVSSPSSLSISPSYPSSSTSMSVSTSTSNAHIDTPFIIRSFNPITFRSILSLVRHHDAHTLDQLHRGNEVSGVGIGGGAGAMSVVSASRRIDARTFLADMISMESRYVEIVAGLSPYEGSGREGRGADDELGRQYQYRYQTTFHADEENIVLAYNPEGRGSESDEPHLAIFSASAFDPTCEECMSSRRVVNVEASTRIGISQA